MMSVVCQREPLGSVAVHNREIVDELAADSNEHNRSTYVPRSEVLNQLTRKRTSHCNTSSQWDGKQRTMDSDALIDHTLKLQSWLNKKSVQTIQEKTDLEARSTRKFYDPVLETENTFVKDVEDLVSHNEVLNVRKKELLHKKWNNQVYEPLRQEIDREMHSALYNQLNKRKREVHKEYLEHTNRKGHVFLDTIAPDEYYPLSLHPVRPSLLTAQTRKLHDPLLSQEHKLNEDDKIIFRCMTGASLRHKDVAQLRLPRLPLVPLGRHGTECNSWLAMPMGDIESPVRLASRRRMLPQSNSHQTTFIDYGLAADQSVVEAEMAIQKRRPYIPQDLDGELIPAQKQTAEIKLKESTK